MFRPAAKIALRLKAKGNFRGNFKNKYNVFVRFD